MLRLLLLLLLILVQTDCVECRFILAKLQIKFAVGTYRKIVIKGTQRALLVREHNVLRVRSAQLRYSIHYILEFLR